MKKTSKRIAVPPLPRAQLATLKALEKFVASNGYAPTYSELGAILGVTKTSVRSSIAYLSDKKLLKKKDGVSRSLIVNRRGRIAASRKPLTPTRKLKGAA